MNEPTPHPSSILIVDDDDDVRLAARVVLRKHFAKVRTTSDPAELPPLLSAAQVDVVLLDMNYSTGVTTGQEGLDWLRKIQRLSPDTKVILMTAYGAVDTAVRGIKEGASDFVVKPWDNDKLVATVTATARFSQAARTANTLASKQKVLNEDVGRAAPIIGSSGAIRSVLAAINKVGPTDANVLIVGENGTGKELVARAIHRASARSVETFVHVDLGAIAESLFESELFGHRKGAFTDARDDRAGRFEVASGGTLFLDEIGNLSLPTQAKLLGALETRTISRVGSDAAVPVDVRILCATNLAPDELRDRRQFRQDVLYRINTVEINVPALRDRVEDVPELVRFYVDVFSRKYGKRDLDVDRPVLDTLASYHWPGNVRELVHAVERAVIMAEGRTLGIDGFLVQRRAPPVADDEDAGELNLAALEKRAIRQAIAKHRGNLSRAAQELGLGRTTLYRKMARHGL
jgi:two-component system, NtrC family, response regulator HydG